MSGCFNMLKTASREGTFFSIWNHSSRRLLPSMIRSSVLIESPMSSSGNIWFGSKSKSPSDHLSRWKTASLICSSTKTSSDSRLRYPNSTRMFPSRCPLRVVFCRSSASSTWSSLSIPESTSLWPRGARWELCVAKKTLPLRKHTYPTASPFVMFSVPFFFPKWISWNKSGRLKSRRLPLSGIFSLSVYSYST